MKINQPLLSNLDEIVQPIPSLKDLQKIRQNPGKELPDLIYDKADQVRENNPGLSFAKVRKIAAKNRRKAVQENETHREINSL